MLISKNKCNIKTQKKLSKKFLLIVILSLSKNLYSNYEILDNIFIIYLITNDHVYENMIFQMH